MAEILYLVHRLPWPPNKGDKVRSHHLLKHLAARHRVHLGTFVDDPDDTQHLPELQRVCASLHVSTLQPRTAKLKSLTGLLRGEPLTLTYYRDAALQAWVQQLRRTQALDAAIVFSSSMAPYAEGLNVPTLVDFVDVDSAKWTDYAPNHRWPLSWLYRREGRELLAYERAVAARAQVSFFATEKEAQLFRDKAPESAGRVLGMNNGVDIAHFTPGPHLANPFAADELPVVFTGAMDYWPNVDAVCWFAQEMLPSLLQRWPRLRFHIVGRGPTAAVRALAGPHVNVTGAVPDVRPFIQHAAAVVAPLRLARGIQNKVLEAMAMGRPVVTASACAEAIDATPGEHLLAAADAGETIAQLDRLLADRAAAEAMGAAARRRVQQVYGWAAQLAVLDQQLAALLGTDNARTPGAAAAGGSTPGAAASAALQRAAAPAPVQGAFRP